MIGYTCLLVCACAAFTSGQFSGYFNPDYNRRVPYSNGRNWHNQWDSYYPSEINSYRRSSRGRSGLRYKRSVVYAHPSRSQPINSHLRQDIFGNDGIVHQNQFPESNQAWRFRNIPRTLNQAQISNKHRPYNPVQLLGRGRQLHNTDTGDLIVNDRIWGNLGRRNIPRRYKRSSYRQTLSRRPPVNSYGSFSDLGDIKGQLHLQNQHPNGNHLLLNMNQLLNRNQHLNRNEVLNRNQILNRHQILNQNQNDFNQGRFVSQGPFNNQDRFASRAQFDHQDRLLNAAQLLGSEGSLGLDKSGILRNDGMTGQERVWTDNVGRRLLNPSPLTNSHRRYKRSTYRPSSHRNWSNNRLSNSDGLFIDRHDPFFRRDLLRGNGLQGYDNGSFNRRDYFQQGASSSYRRY